MTTAISGFFWSYTHLDNDYDHGRILRLAELIRDEYGMRTGKKLEIFVDRTHIQWGEPWRDRLNLALEDTKFFIPVITPRYFESAECRRELLKFAGNAESLGVGQLILPILYIETPGIDIENPRDEVVAHVARMQYEDWRQLRFEAEDSPVHRRSVSRLVNRLVAITAMAHAQRADGPHAAAEDMREDEFCTLDIVASLEQAIPRWGKAFEGLGAAMSAIDSATERIAADDLRFESLDLSAGAATAKQAVLRRYAEEISAPTQDMLDCASEFAAEVIGINPGILTLIRAAENADEDHPAEDFVDFACDLILVLSKRIRHNIETVRAYSMNMSLLSKGSRVLRPPVATVGAAIQRANDGFELLEEWERRIRASGREMPHIPGFDDE